MKAYGNLTRKYLWQGMVSLFYLAIFSGIVKAQDWSSVTAPFDIMQEGYIQVVGRSAPGQNEYDAIKSAEADAQANLLEIFKGMAISQKKSIVNGMRDSIVIRTAVEGYLRGAYTCGETYFPSTGSAKVCMRLNVRGRGGVYESILPLLAQEGLINNQPKISPYQAPDTVPAGNQNSVPTTPVPSTSIPSMTGAVTTPSDGLLLTIDGMGFRPAIVNRVISESGELIFGPSKIVNDILIERGPGGYTDSNDKANSLLKLWGSVNPLSVRAKDVRNGTDVVINTDDAAKVFAENQRSNFISEAKVVYVVQQ